MTIKPLKVGALFAFLFAFAFVANAVQQTLPTPPPSAYPDTESEANVSVTNWPSLGRRVKLTLTANFTTSNCVQVAFGQDTNSDGNLAPEETHLILGIDCGVPFIHEEVGQWSDCVSNWRSPTGILSASTEESNLDCPPPPPTSTFVFAFKQPSPLAKRVTNAKVTTRGRGNSAAEIAAEITRPGVVFFIR